MCFFRYDSTISARCKVFSYLVNTKIVRNIIGERLSECVTVFIAIGADDVLDPYRLRFAARDIPFRILPYP
ncbi:hypothetical protein HMPREF9554_00648 [Treponema phagedenis F0421]|nr:hypothetical protein HMPREF9554_00648 [Treponema phagedenis F0421]